jgi:hypothetical protein
MDLKFDKFMEGLRKEKKQCVEHGVAYACR